MGPPVTPGTAPSAPDAMAPLTSVPSPLPTATQGDAPPSPTARERPAASGDIRDRAFIASVLSLHLDAKDREQVQALYERIRRAARSHHAELRGRLSTAPSTGAPFVSHLQEAPLEIRDHLVEEILDTSPIRRSKGRCCCPR